jgi:hypothetical protein
LHGHPVSERQGAGRAHSLSGLDETRPKAIEALVKQARSDADMTNAKCAYADTNPEAALICSLFDSAPPLTDPLVSRKSPGARAVP